MGGADRCSGWDRSSSSLSLELPEVELVNDMDLVFTATVFVDATDTALPLPLEVDETEADDVEPGGEDGRDEGGEVGSTAAGCSLLPLPLLLARRVVVRGAIQAASCSPLLCRPPHGTVDCASSQSSPLITVRTRGAASHATPSPPSSLRGSSTLAPVTTPAPELVVAWGRGGNGGVGFARWWTEVGELGIW